MGSARGTLTRLCGGRPHPAAGVRLALDRAGCTRAERRTDPVAFGAMGWFRIPLDAGTVILGSLALGVAVDDTVHLTEAFVNARERGAEQATALREALARVLPPITYTTAVVATGFLVLGFSGFTLTPESGPVDLGVVMVLCLIADLSLLPLLLTGGQGRLKAESDLKPASWTVDAHMSDVRTGCHRHGLCRVPRGDRARAARAGSLPRGRRVVRDQHGVRRGGLDRLSAALRGVLARPHRSRSRAGRDLRASPSGRHPVASTLATSAAGGWMLLTVVSGTGGASSDYYVGLVLLLIGIGVLVPLSARQGTFAISSLFACYVVMVLSGERTGETEQLALSLFFSARRHSSES